MNNSNNKCKCTEKCQTLLENPFECFPKYGITHMLQMPTLMQYLFSSNSGDQKNIDLSKYEVKPLNSFKTNSIKEVLISNAHHEKTSNANMPKKNFVNRQPNGEKFEK